MIPLLMSKSIKERLEALEAAAEAFGDPDFAARIEVESGDELGRVETAFNQMAERLEKKAAWFSELDRVKSDFVSNVSHELRTPLTTIKALTRLLMRDADLAEEKRREYLETISVECDRQIDFVLNLLDLSRIEGGVYRLSVERVELIPVIESCVKAELTAAEKRRHTLRIESLPKLAPACADPKALRRVVSNLIENSIKYTPDGGLIQLSAHQEPDFVCLSVADNGRGIPPEDLPVLFDKFHRGRPAPHSAVTKEMTDYTAFLEDADVSGVGLGLYLAKNVIEQMGGQISVETEVSRGSIFTIHLPVWTRATCGRSITVEDKQNGETIAGR